MKSNANILKTIQIGKIGNLINICMMMINVYIITYVYTYMHTLCIHINIVNLKLRETLKFNGKTNK